MSTNQRPATLLFISPTFPLPMDRGQRVRVFNLLKACCSAFTVTLLAPPPDPGTDITPLEALGVRLLPQSAAPVPHGVKDLIAASWRAGELFTPHRMADMAPYQAALDTVELAGFDLIFVERGHLSVLAAGFYPRTVVDLDDLEHVRLLREMQDGMSLAAAARRVPRLIRLFLRETWGLRRFRAAIVCSQDDRRRLRRWGVRNLLVVPNGADIPAQPESPPAPLHDAVFLGNCDYPPNRDAIALLRAEILPDLRATHPDFSVDLIGPGSQAFDAPSEGLHGLGFVDDLYGTLATYRMLIAPLRTGGGTKLKIIDCLAAGVPVVTTPLGAEGLDLIDGETALIADTPAGIARHVRTLLADPRKGQALAAAARAHAEKTLSWPQLRDDLAHALAQWAAR